MNKSSKNSKAVLKNYSVTFQTKGAGEGWQKRPWMLSSNGDQAADALLKKRFNGSNRFRTRAAAQAAGEELDRSLDDYENRKGRLPRVFGGRQIKFTNSAVGLGHLYGIARTEYRVQAIVREMLDQRINSRGARA